jgi:hypothetical protein
MEKLGYAIITDYTAVCDDKKAMDPKTYNIFGEGDAPTAEQAFFHEIPPNIGKAPPVMQTIFEGVIINHGRIHYKAAKPVTAPPGQQARAVMKYDLRR